MTRIISGKARSLNLLVPKSGTRPTSDRVREALFSTLESWNAIADMRALDLFAGTGSLGLEAASRGAAEVTFLEKHPPAVNLLRRNVSAAKKLLAKSDTFIALDALRGSANTFFDDQDESHSWDLIFIDPPYEYQDKMLNKLLINLIPHLSAEGVVVVERSSKSKPLEWPFGLLELKHKKYGDTTIWFAEKNSTI